MEELPDDEPLLPEDDEEDDEEEGPESEPFEESEEEDEATTEAAAPRPALAVAAAAAAAAATAWVERKFLEREKDLLRATAPVAAEEPAGWGAARRRRERAWIALDLILGCSRVRKASALSRVPNTLASEQLSREREGTRKGRYVQRGAVGVWCCCCCSVGGEGNR